MNRALKLLERFIRVSVHAMEAPDFAENFRSIYDRATARYARGSAAATLLDSADTAFLAANGITAQHLFDYVEDRANYGEPSCDEALAIEVVRRDYFLNVQNGLPSPTVLDPASLPPKTQSIQGIAWLPRLLPKARAKLRGELPASMMYGCGGDRAFFQEHRMSGADFLGLVARNLDADAPIVAAVASTR